MKNIKNKIVLALILAVTVNAYSQSPAFKYEPYFSAVIVSNIDSSVQWYKSVFGLKIQNEINDAQSGVRVVILESLDFLIELLELKGSLTPKKILEGKTEGTEMQGLFKFGFKVADMDACLQQLENLKIHVPRVYTDAASKKRNFLVTDPDGNLLQFFE